MDYLDVFNETLKELFEDNGLNKLRFQKSTGISAHTVWGWESKKYYPAPKTVMKIADYFKCSSDYLFGLTDKREGFVPKENRIEFIFLFDKLEKENNLNDNRIAKFCNIGNAAVAKWRRFRRLPTTEILLKLTELFHCSLEYLLGRED